MALNPTYLNLSGYQTGNSVNPLDALIAGAEQGLQLQQLPQQLRDQALARELNNAINQQKILNLQNPELALQQDLQKKALEAILTGKNPSVVFEPQVSPELQAMRQTALDAGGVDLGTAPPPSDFQQLVPALRGQRAIGISPSAGLAAEQRKQAFEKEKIEARYRDAGISVRAVQNAQGGYDIFPTKMFDGQMPTATPLKRPDGSDVTAPTKGIKQILVTNEKTGRVTNLTLAPGEEVPEGFKIETKKTSEDFKSIDAFRKEIASNDVVKQFSDVVKSQQRIDEAIKEASTTNNFTVVDQVLISSFNRLLEPDSVTMVSEYARTSADAPIINRIRAAIERGVQGGRLTDEERAAVSRMTERIYQTSFGNYSKAMDFYEGIGDRRKWSSEDYIPPLGSFRESINVSRETNGMTEMIAPNGTRFNIPSKNVDQAIKEGARIP